MNIGIDIRALGFKKLTGVGSYIFNAINNIVALDKKNHYYLFSAGFKKEVYNYLDWQQENIHHIHLTIPNKILNFCLFFGFPIKAYNNFFKKIDLFWMPNINFYCNKKSIPLIITIHDLSFLQNREFYSLKRRLWHKFVNVKKLIKKASQIIAVSEHTQRDVIRSFSVGKDKISVINPGVASAEITIDLAKNLIKSFNLPAKYFIYVGTLEPRKNIDSIIRAFDRYHRDYPDRALVIVGNRGWVYKSLLKEIAKRHFVYYLDYVDNQTKNALYFSSQGLIWPSFYEGFGFPPLEAMAYHIPLIVSFKTSLPEVLKEQALYVDPYNISDIYQSLKLLTEDNKLSEQLKTSAKKFIVPTWSAQAEKVINLFNSYRK